METTCSYELEDHLPDIERLIKGHTWRLAKAGKIQRDDRDDFAQDLLLHIVKAWPQLVQTDFEPLGFAQLVIRQKTSNELRQRKVQYELQKKASVRTTTTHDDLTPELANEAIASLSNEDQEFVQSLLVHGQTSTAERLGIDRPALLRRMRAIQRQLLE